MVTWHSTQCMRRAGRRASHRLSNFIQIRSANEPTFPSKQMSCDSAPQHERKVPRTILNATAMARKNVCWASESCYRKLRLSMAASCHSLARQEEAMDTSPVSWGSAESVKLDGIRHSFGSTNHRLGEPALGRHREEKTVRHKSRTAS